ncbi:MAG TPA: MlaD family protein [Phycisphaerales bacterium]|nr:MlaD family protein [Phycisphaerales bacterium]HMP38054.1 MlaD family protein [Phycisphaerales bacterium]
MTEQPPHHAATSEEALPVATALPRRSGLGALWLVPAAAAALALWIGFSAWRERGIPVTVTFAQGHGIGVGDAVKHRGLIVGSVRSARLARDGGSVVVDLSLRRDAAELARAGARFWLVRPEIGFQGVSGIETIIGARYVAVIAGDGPPQRIFVGLEEAPVVLRRRPEDLSIIIETPRRGSLSPGSPLTYRQVPVGVVESISLAGDAGSVEIVVHVEAEYAPLIRERTVFWDAGGIEVGVGLRGVTAAMESPESLLRGALALATPPDPGAPARRGDRYKLSERLDDAWLRWRPSIALGSGFLAPGLPTPRPIPFVRTWKGRLLGGERSRSGLALPTTRGVVAPEWLAAGAEDARAGTLSIEFGGSANPAAWSPPLPIIAASDGAALIAVDPGVPGWPADRIRRFSGSEEVVAFGGDGVAPLPLSPARLSARGAVWFVDRALAIDPRLDGAAVVSRTDGFVVGLLLVEPGESRIVPIPERRAEAPPVRTP